MPRKYSPATQRKVGKVLKEYEAGHLHSGRSGQIVHSKKQAIAIALSQAPGRKKSSATEIINLCGQ